MATQYKEAGLNLDTTESMYLGTETSKTAQKWCHELKVDIIDEWEMMNEAFKKSAQRRKPLTLSKMHSTDAGT